MEPIISKLQEGVKYPRFERDATTIINDLVEHITKERGVYSSSIEPNPNEHSIWYNTNDNGLYIYNGDTWAIVSAAINISKESALHPYPTINIFDDNEYIDDGNIERNNHYVIIVNTSNIRNYLNTIVTWNADIKLNIIGDDTNIDGTFLVNIYDTYIYYIKISSLYIKEGNVLYCNEATLFYSSTNGICGYDGLAISGFYTKERLRYEIEELEYETLEYIDLKSMFIDFIRDATIIIGKQNFISDIAILGKEAEDCSIYMYNNILSIGNNQDSGIVGNLYWNNNTIYCNCKSIGDITITHEGSNIPLQIDSIDFVVGNNNHLIISQSVAECIETCNIYVIDKIDNDKSDVLLQGDITNGEINTYINLCGTKMLVNDKNSTYCINFITTTLDDISYDSINDACIDFATCKTLIIDAPYKEIKTGAINYLKTFSLLKVYATDDEVCNYLNRLGLLTTKVYRVIYVTTDRIDLTYSLNVTPNSTKIFDRTIYVR